MDRLVNIISLSPSLAPQAFKRALELLVVTTQRDTEYYKTILGTYENVSSRPGVRLPPVEELLPDHSRYLAWVEETNERNNAERRKLEVELKTYTGNMIKESIRMAYRDLSTFYRATGSFEGSLRHLTKSREYCSSTQDMLEMCLSVLEVATFPHFHLSCCGGNIADGYTFDSFSWNNAAFHTYRPTSSRQNPLWIASDHPGIRPQTWLTGQALRAQGEQAGQKRSICTNRSKRNLHCAPRFRTWRTGIMQRRRTISSSRCLQRHLRPGMVPSSRWLISRCMQRSVRLLR
jgi:hypothetical protein